MKVLVANLGSTSFKYRLFDMETERQLARGGIERIGADASPVSAEIAGKRLESTMRVPDHAVAVRCCLDQLTDPERGCLKDAAEVSAIGFKAVHGGRISGVQRVTEDVLAAMEEMSSTAPAHNPPYIRAMRLLRERLPGIPLVAAFETDFHRTVPDRNRYYAVPYEWAEWQVLRWGFHGASHRYIAARTAELLGRNDLRVISCHLGGSSSLCAIRNGQSVFTSMGMSPQTGLPNNNRVGDFDAFAIPIVMAKAGWTLEQTLEALANKSGLLGLSGVGTDMRDIRLAAAQGNRRAALAIEVFTASIRHYLGACLVELGGADVVVFTGGIGENDAELRAAVCEGLEELGIVPSPDKNRQARGECDISDPRSRVRIWTMPTNEELMVARQVRDLLQAGG